MSYDPNDAAFDDFVSEIYKSASEDWEVQDRIIDKYLESRLSDYYVNHPLLIQPAHEALKEAKTLKDAHPRVSLILANTSIEVVFTDGILMPILYASFSHESIDKLFKLLFSQKIFDFKDALQKNVPVFTSINIVTFKRATSSVTLLTEIKDLKGIRNKIIHNADTATVGQARQAIDIAETLFREIFCNIIKNLGLHLHNDERICGSKKSNISN